MYWAVYIKTHECSEQAAREEWLRFATYIKSLKLVIGHEIWLRSAELYTLKLLFFKHIYIKTHVPEDNYRILKKKWKTM